jgi:hypothetical protein
MNRQINNILSTLNIQPVLVDIGASGAPPKIWAPIARHSTYIGFDPDRRDLHDVPDGQFARSIIINEAVTNVPDQSEVRIYLTSSPHCSSTLLPDTKSLADYLFCDLFTVEKEVSVPASSLNAVINRLGLHRVDWLKTDSQGTDLRLFESLKDDLRNRVLAIDIEPGLIDAYKGEDLFVDAHRRLLQQGFWLSSLDTGGSVRMKRSTLQAMTKEHPKLKDIDTHQAVRPSPGWCKACYLRTIESLKGQNAELHDYVLLWVFAMMEQQWGYALDIAYDYRQQFRQDAVSSQLQDLPLKQIYRQNQNFRVFVQRLFPRQLKKFLKQIVRKQNL